VDNCLDISVDYLVTSLDHATRTHDVIEAQRIVLLVDDNPLLLRCLRRALGKCPLPIVTCTSPLDAVATVAAGNVEVVISDISMPQMSGLELLRRIHAHDPDLPVVLLTGVPCVNSAAEAVEHGAFSYLMKPAKPEVLLLNIERASLAFNAARQQRAILSKLGCHNDKTQVDDLERTFEDALGSIWLAFQPIVHVSNRTVAGYEALLRSESPVLAGPESVLQAAQLLSAMDRVGRGVRERAAQELQNRAESVTLFVNLHPQDLLDDELRHPGSALANVANRVVLEITERGGLANIDDLPQKLKELRRLGFRIAVDDLGAGHSGLNNVAELEPEFIKLDMTLVRNIDQSAIKQKLVSSLLSLAESMGTTIIAEGIETRAECRTVVNLGCTLLQGFLFARPEREFPMIDWPSSAKHGIPVASGTGSDSRHAQSGVHPVRPNH
jgi:EAL domain-containing protein (putative c-di-GMP-specific phosphodiesterase class I)/CheY-like chemotaxis protein